MAEDVELVRLAPAEVDDQAIAEVRRLTPFLRSDGAMISTRALIELVASGRAVVARRPCGASPEIIGLALTERFDGRALRSALAVDPELGGPEVERRLRRAVRAQSGPLFLFRPGRRPPLGLSAALP